MDKTDNNDTAAMLAGQSDIPRHVAVIMDGNGRWAKGRGLPRIAGHRKGVERVRDMVSACAERGIKHLTLFAFSSENWRRPAQEVQLLMDLFLSALENEIRKLHKNNVRFRVIGDIARFGEKIAARIRQAEMLTHDNQALTLTIAANYGGRWDIAQACAQLAQRAVNGEIDPATHHGGEHRTFSQPGRRSRTRSFHPHRRRAAHQQFSVVAAGLHRDVFHPGPVAGFRSRAIRAGAGLVCRTPAPFRSDR